MISRRGSVLMEFLLVTPLYLAFIGGTFAVGQLLISSIDLAHADRAWAMCPDEFRAAAKAALNGHLFPLSVFSYDDKMMSVASDTLSLSDRTHRADEKFVGAWTWLTAARVGNSHHHPPWTRGWFSFASDAFDASVPDAAGHETALEKMSRFVSVFAMETERKYNYYSLKRTVKGRRSYRSWDPVNLTNVPIDFGALSVSDAVPVWGAAWFSNIYMEPFPETDSAKLDAAAQEADEVPDEPSWRTEYSRFPSFMLWSQ